MSEFRLLFADYEQLLKLRSRAGGGLEQGSAYLQALEAALARLEGLWEDLLVNPRFRLALAESPHAPPALLEWLAGDTEQEVRLAVARNPAVPAAAFPVLTQNWAGRLALACNPCAPGAVLETLASDGDPDVRQALAANPNTPVPVLARLTRDPERAVRRKVALNRGTPPRLLVRLARQADPALYLALVRNPKTPQAVLERIAEADPSLGERVRAHPNAQPSPLPAKVYRRERAGKINLDCPVCRSTQGQIYGSRRAG